jgi:hypothetical protein
LPGVRLPANVELEDRLAFGLTGRQLAIIAAALVSAYGLESLLAALLPTPVALAAALLLGAIGIALSLARHAGLHGEQLALALTRFALTPRKLLLAPDGLPAPLPGSPSSPGRSRVIFRSPGRIARGVVAVA